MKALLLISALILGQPQASPAIAGKWLWQGSTGWQRIVLDLKLQGTVLTGVLRMGPGGGQPRSPEEFWEFFFDPADFKIINGKVEGNTVYFEHDAEKAIPGSPSGFRGAPPPRKQSSRFVYRGTIMENRIVLTRETSSQTSDPWVLGTHKVEFALERMNLALERMNLAPERMK